MLHKLVAKHLLSLLHEERIIMARLSNKQTWSLPMSRIQELKQRAESLRKRIVDERRAVMMDLADLLRFGGSCSSSLALHSLSDRGRQLLVQLLCSDHVTYRFRHDDDPTPLEQYQEGCCATQGEWPRG